MKYFLILIAIYHFNLTYSQNILFEEDFDNNDRNWVVKNNWNRKASISNGLLTDYFSEDGLQVSNLVSLSFNKKEKHCIIVKIANLNNKDGYYYHTYTKKSNDNIKKSGKASNPSYKIAFGFKDWENYHVIEFASFPNSYGSPVVYHKLYSILNGETMIHNDWSSYNTEFMDKNTGFNTISIKKSNDKYVVYHGNYEVLQEQSKYLGTIPLSKWYGDDFGFIIPAGTKIAVDYIKVIKEIEIIKNKYVSNFEISIKDVNRIVEQLDESQDSVDIWIDTDYDGNRKISFEDSRVSGLENDEYYLCLEFSKGVFKYFFEAVNYNREKPINSPDLVQALKNKSIIGMEFETESRVHSFEWEEITTE